MGIYLYELTFRFDTSVAPRPSRQFFKILIEVITFRLIITFVSVYVNESSSRPEIKS